MRLIQIKDIIDIYVYINLYVIYATINSGNKLNIYKIYYNLNILFSWVTHFCI